MPPGSGQSIIGTIDGFGSVFVNGVKFKTDDKISDIPRPIEYANVCPISGVDRTAWRRARTGIRKRR